MKFCVRSAYWEFGIDGCSLNFGFLIIFWQEAESRVREMEEEVIGLQRMLEQKDGELQASTSASEKVPVITAPILIFTFCCYLACGWILAHDITSVVNYWLMFLEGNEGMSPLCHCK